LARIESIAESGDVPEETADRLRAIYQARLNRVTARLNADTQKAPTGGIDVPVREALLGAERDALARLNQERAFPTHTLRDIGRGLDLEELRRR
jgi:hypothetical protein